MSRKSSIPIPLAFGCMLAFASTQGSSPAMAQDEPFGILGKKPDRPRALFGVWSFHPFTPDSYRLQWTSGLGGVVSQYFGATLINSYNERAFTFGVERYWVDETLGPFDLGVGYRAGFVTGYDERLLAIAKHTPILPYVGLLAWTDLGPVGLDVFYVYRAVTLELSFHLPL